MLSVRVDGVDLRAIGPYAEVTMSHVWPHGSEFLSWRMPATLRRAVLDRGGARVEGFDCGIRRWWGRLAEPAADGEYKAVGAWSAASGVYALDGSGDATNIPDTAIDNALTKTGWTRPVSLSAVAWGAASTTADAPMKLTDLLDEAMAGLGKRPYVDENGAVRAAADPTVPLYVVPQVAAGRGLTLAEDDYYSHLTGSFLAAGPIYDTVTVGNAAAAARWGYREARVDLTDMGVITGATATTELNARLALTGARLTFAETLQVGYGQITTPGGTPVSLATPRAGEMVRLMGVTDHSRPAGNLPYTDIVIGRSVYTDGAPTVALSPVGLAARSNQDVLVRGAAA